MVAFCGCLVVSMVIGGCTIGSLGVSYVPQQNAKPIKDAAAIPVEVSVEDKRPPPSYWGTHIEVSHAVETLKGAAETELKARGFKIGNGGAQVTIQLVRFDAQIEPEGFFGVTKVSRGFLGMRVQVYQQTGKVTYSRDIDEERRAGGIYIYRKGTPELDGPLEAAFQQLFADPAFTAAILATRQPPPAKPVVSPGRSAGAFAIMSRR
jgi:hypothetical protein